MYKLLHEIKKLDGWQTDCPFVRRSVCRFGKSGHWVRACIFVLRCSARRSPKISKKRQPSVLFTFVHVQPSRISTVNPLSVCTLLISFDSLVLQNLKTSVCSILNSSWTDVFIFCNKRPSEENKRTQTGGPTDNNIKRKTAKFWQRNFRWVCTNSTRTCIKCPDLGNLRAEHLTDNSTSLCTR